MNASRKVLLLTTFLAIFVTTSSIHADVMSWRNGGNGEYASNQLPENWQEHVLWQTALDQKSNSSPILIKGRLYFCQEPNALVCADSKTGEILWKRQHELMDFFEFSEEEKAQALELGERNRELRRELNRRRNEARRLTRQSENQPENEELKQTIKEKRAEFEALRAQRLELSNDPKFPAIEIVPTHQDNGYTSFTPVSDGKYVYAAFGHGVLAAYDLDGNKIWSKRMEHPNPANGPGGAARWGGSTSPILVDGMLIVRFADYTALNPETGEEIWRIPSGVVYGTPAVFEVEGQSFLFTSRGRVIRASDGEIVQDGLVQLHHRFDWTVFNTPFIKDGIIYTVRGFKWQDQDGHAYAYRIPQDLETLNTKGLELIWHTDKVHHQRYYASPIVHKGLMYIFSQDFVFSALDANTGEILYKKKIDGFKGTAYPSLSLVGETLFAGADDGVVIALQPGSEYKEIARSQFEQFRSTPIFLNNIAYLRTYENLYAIKAN